MKLEINDIEKTAIFCHIFKCLKDVVDIVTLDFKEGGLYFQAMDSSHICLCELMLCSNWFDKYTLDKGEVVTIPTIGIFQVLNCFKDTQSIHIEYNQEILNIEFIGENMVGKSFTLKTMECDSELLEIPEVDYSVDIEIKSNELNTIIQELTIFSDEIEFICKDDLLKLVSNGEIGTMNVEINDDHIISYASEENLELIRKFSTKYFKQACSFYKISENINLHLEADSPIKIAYYIENEESYFKFYIAPKIDDDEF